MATRFQAFKEEFEQLVFIALKLVVHWLALVVMLGFVLLGFWLHHLFRRAYVELEQQQTVEAKSQKGGQPVGNCPRAGENRRRARKSRSRRFSRKATAVKPVSSAPKTAL